MSETFYAAQCGQLAGGLQRALDQLDSGRPDLAKRELATARFQYATAIDARDRELDRRHGAASARILRAPRAHTGD